MSDEKNTPAPAGQPDFGEIQISLGGGLPSRSRSSSKPPALKPVKQKLRPIPSSPAPTEKVEQRKKAGRSGNTGRLLFILLLLLPFVLLAGWLAGAWLFLPMYIKGPLAKRLGDQLGRPVTIAQVSLSPFSLDLHLSEITVGTAAAHPNEQNLARIDSIAAQLRPAALLRGQIALDDVRVDRLRADFLRRRDGSFSALPSGGGLFGGFNVLPDWLRVNGLRLSRSTVHFLDQPSGKEHLIEHIEFFLPPAGQGKEPILSAVVNSSPLQLTGQKQEGGNPETRLTLKLDELDPQQYLGLLPGLAQTANVSAERTDAVLEIILQDSGKGPAITVSVTFSALLVQSAAHEQQTEQAFRLAAPTAHAIIRFNPMQKLCTVEELLLDAPQIDLTESQEELLDGAELAAKAAALLNLEQIGLAVSKFSLSKGKVTSGKKEWTDVQAELTGFQNAKFAEVTKEKTDSALSLSAMSGNASVSFKGSVDPACNLNGSVNLQNMRADLLRPYLSANDGLRFSKGTVDIIGELRLEQQTEGKPVLKITGGTVAARDFALQQKKTALLTGKTFNGTDCVLDGDDRSMSCGKAALEGADFADTVFFLSSIKKADDSGKLRFSCSNLELKNAAAKLPFGLAPLPLSGLHLTLTGLGEQQPGQINLDAATGKQGRIALNGTAAKSKDGGLLLSGKLSLKNADADLLHSYLSQSEDVHFAQGGAEISGAFNMSGPVLNLSEGTVAVRDFNLQRGGAALLSGKEVSGADCSLDGSRQRMSCGKVTLNGANFADAEFFLPGCKKGKLRLSCSNLEIKNSAARMPFGPVRLPLSGLNMTLTGLTDKQSGQISLNAASGSGKIELSGTAAKEEAGLALSGNLTLRNVDPEILHPYLGDGITFSKGGADLSGTFKTSGSVLNLSGGSVAVRDFSLQRGGAALLSGKEIVGADCSLDGGSQQMRCGKVTVEGADFADTGFFLNPAGRLRFAANNVELKNASARMVLGETVIPLSGLNMTLNGLPGQFSLEAAGLEINGAAAKEDSGLALSGKLSLRNVGAAMLNSYLGDELHFSKGGADISGTGRLSTGEGGVKLHLSGGTIAVRDFSLQREGVALLSGKLASGADCALGSGLTCGKITVEQADFAAAAPGFFFRPTDRLRLSANAVDISGSSALLPVGLAQLPLSGLEMSLTGLREQQPSKNNLQFVAAVGQGSLKAEGQLHRNGSGMAELTAERLDLRLFSKAFASLFRDELTIKQGSLNSKGEFRLPESRFSGSLSIDNLAAETGQGDSLHWRRATTDKAALALSPFSLAAEKLAVEEPQLQLASAEHSLPAAFFGLFAEPPQLAIEQCSLSNGSLQRGGSKFSGIQGTIGPVKAGTAADFSFTGKMGGSDFAASGNTDKNSANLDKLTVERLPLDGVTKELAKQLALDSSRGQLTRTVSPVGDRLDFSGFVPQAASEYALAFALLTEKDGGFSMPLQSVPFSASDEAIAKAAIEMLQKLRSTPPWTVLEKLVPNLPKTQNIDFLPGDKVPDFMEGMDSLRTLFSSRPHLGWAVKGCFDQEADRKALLAQAQKNGGQKIEEENVRRKQELDRLLAQEVLRQLTLNKAGLPIVKDQLPELKARPNLQPLPASQAELPENALPELARARAEVVRDHLISKLGIPAERVKIEESGTCGAKAELNLSPVW